jgi:hypothetical protein
MNQTVLPPEQRVEILKARTRAFRFPKGQSGNPSGQSRFYHEARMLARRAAPDVMKELIGLALRAEDERVKSVCAVAVLDRAGIRPYDADPAAEEAQSRHQARINPADYSDEELERIKNALELIARRREEKRTPAAVGEEQRRGL